MNNCLTCCDMAFPNDCSFLGLSSSRLKLHLSKLLCRLFNVKLSPRVGVCCDSWCMVKGQCGETPACLSPGDLEHRFPHPGAGLKLNYF